MQQDCFLMRINKKAPRQPCAISGVEVRKGGGILRQFGGRDSGI